MWLFTSCTRTYGSHPLVRPKAHASVNVSFVRTRRCRMSMFRLLVNCRKPHDLDWTPKVSPAQRLFYFDEADSR